MPNNKYKILSRYLHVVDNSEKGVEKTARETFFKVRPVREAVR